MNSHLVEKWPGTVPATSGIDMPKILFISDARGTKTRDSQSPNPGAIPGSATSPCCYVLFPALTPQGLQTPKHVVVNRGHSSGRNAGTIWGTACWGDPPRETIGLAHVWRSALKGILVNAFHPRLPGVQKKCVHIPDLMYCDEHYCAFGLGFP
jgi:hypothetical protein